MDKTAMVYQLVKTGHVYFLSRPRRFGKSLLVSTLRNYFEGRKELFQGLAIEKLETEWNQYPVFHIDFNGGDFLTAGSLEGILEGIVSSWERQYGKSPDYTDVGNRFAYVLHQARQQYGRRCAVLIDEYDKPILDVLDTGRKTSLDGQECLLETAIGTSSRLFTRSSRPLTRISSSSSSPASPNFPKSACSAASTNPPTSA